MDGRMEQMAKIETWKDNEDNKKTGSNRMAEENRSSVEEYILFSPLKTHPPLNSATFHFMSLLLSAPWMILSLL